MPAHFAEFLAGPEEFVALGELADDLIRRVPPAVVRCHVDVDSSLPEDRATESHNDWTTTTGSPQNRQHVAEQFERSDDWVLHRLGAVVRGLYELEFPQSAEIVSHAVMRGTGICLEKVLPDEIRWRGPRACSNRT